MAGQSSRVPDPAIRPPGLTALLALAVTATYYCAAKLGLSMAFVAEQVSPVWPPTGIALTAVLLLGYRIWPGIALGAFLANVTAHEPIGTAVGIAFGNTLEALLGAWLLQRFVGFRPTLERLRDVLGLVILAAILPTSLCALIGVASLCFGGAQPWSLYGPLVRIWWLGDATGALVVAPFLLTWLTGSQRPKLSRILEGIALLSGLAGVCLILFAGGLNLVTTNRPLEFVVFPFVIWAALRFGVRGAANVTLVASAIAIGGTVSRLGPFGQAPVHESLLLLQTFLGAVAVSGLLLGAVMAEREVAERRQGIHYAVSQALAESVSAKEAIPRILRAVCKGLDWDVGALWLVDKTANVLHCEDVWTTPARNGRAFEETTWKRKFAPGIGLPGRVWSTAQSAWIPDVSQDENFPRGEIARKEGLRAAFGFPVLRDNAVWGVMEFFNRQIQLPDEDLLRMMGAISGQIGLFLDRRVQEESRLRLAAILEATTDFVGMADVHGHPTYINQAGRRLLGLGAEENVTGTRITDYSPPWAAKLIADQGLPTAMAHGVWSGETAFLSRDGTQIPVSQVILAHLSSRGAVEYFSTIARDISERKQAEHVLRANEEKFRGIVDIANEGIWIIDSDAKITLLNNKMAEILGYPREEVLGKCKGDFVFPEDQAHIAALFERRQAGISEQADVRFRHKSGREVWTIMAARALFDDEGQFQGALDLFTDITDRKKAEASLKDADRQKDEFLAMLAHELRNPLAPIHNAVQIFRLIGPTEPKLNWARDMIERQLGQLTRLVDDLLDISRITRGKIRLHLEPIALSSVVDRAVETSRPLIDTRRHELTISLPAEPILIEADSTRLAQVFANLLNNSAKYMDEGGHIWLTVAQEESDIAIRVRDIGMGIPATLLPHVFELFAQGERSLDRSHGGLGIGLTLVKRLVEMHHGRVDAFSEGAGQGSEFVVRLPALVRNEIVQATDGQSDGAAGASTRGRRILVVDDNVDAAESLAMILRADGHEVHTAFDGLSGLEAANRLRPEVIFLDIGLPGMDGYEVARKLREQFKSEDLRLVALTGYGQEEDRRRSRAVGIDHHFVKPVDPEMLQAVLSETVNTSS